jgi:hypothetical protein
VCAKAVCMRHLSSSHLPARTVVQGVHARDTVRSCGCWVQLAAGSSWLLQLALAATAMQDGAHTCMHATNGPWQISHCRNMTTALHDGCACGSAGNSGCTAATGCFATQQSQQCLLKPIGVDMAAQLYLADGQAVIVAKLTP